MHCDLPDVYALNHWACSLQALDIHISQIPHAHAITITCITLYYQYVTINRMPKVEQQ